MVWLLGLGGGGGEGVRCDGDVVGSSGEAEGTNVVATGQ